MPVTGAAERVAAFVVKFWRALWRTEMLCSCSGSGCDCDCGTGGWRGVRIVIRVFHCDDDRKA